MILIVSLVLGVAALLASHLISRQVGEMKADLERKASAYALMTARQVESAIAFDDRETAREVFDSVAQDQDVETLTLYTSKGQVLHARGALTASLPSELKRVSGPTRFAEAGRVGVAVPVVSLEGPRGTLLLELSTRRLTQSRAAVMRHALLAGGLAMLVGALGAFLIARPLAQRLHAIASVADAVAAGDLAQQPVKEDQARDEIGVLARAFNAMLRQLQSLIEQIRESAREEQHRLEELVKARTVELAGRNDDLRQVLNNVGQGFLTIDREGRMSRERSAILDTWFGPPPESGLFVEYLRKIDEATASWFEVGWVSVLEDLLPLEVNIGQLPRRVTRGDRHFDLDYRPLLTRAGALDRVVIVLSDVTAAVDGARAEAGEREAMRLFVRLLADRPGFLEFFREAGNLVKSVRASQDPVELRRSLHTLKGNAGLFGLETLAMLCHDLEDRLADNRTPTEADLQPLLSRWAEVSAKIRTLVGDERNVLEIADSDYREMFAAIEKGAPHSRLREMISRWHLEPTQTRLRRLGEQAEALALRLGKGPIVVEIESNQVRLAPDRWGSFWAAAAHVIRNAIDHGLEGAEERTQRGKPATASVRLRTVQSHDALTIEVSDDGRGIAWEAVRKRAVALGLSASTQADLEQALFADGLSTREVVTDLSGRGVGLAAARRACLDLGGKVEVESKEGSGTAVRFVWPASVVSSGVPRSRTPRPINLHP